MNIFKYSAGPVIRFIKKMRSSSRKIERQVLYDHYIATFIESPSGEAVLEHLANIHFVGRPTIAKSDRLSAFNDGRKYVVESIIHVINSDLEKLEELNRKAQKAYEEQEI